MLSYEEVEPIFMNLLGDYGTPSEIGMPQTTWQQKIAALRGRVMKRLVNEVSTAFARHQQEILSGKLNGSLLAIAVPTSKLGLIEPKSWRGIKSLSIHKKQDLKLSPINVCKIF